jgi:hypothetical protein
VLRAFRSLELVGIAWPHLSGGQRRYVTGLSRTYWEETPCFTLLFEFQPCEPPVHSHCS